MSRTLLHPMLFAAAIVGVLPGLAGATSVYCVADAATFKADLLKYADPYRADDMELRVVQGTYAMGSLPAGFADYITGNGSGYKLSILGGYTAGCVSRTVNPTNTVYDGQDVSQSGLALDLDGNLLIEGLTFTRLNFGVNTEQTNAPDGESIVFRYNIVANNSKLADGYDAYGLVLYPNHTLVVHDNLFFGNANVAHTYPYATDALSVMSNDGAYAWIVNNTIADNTGISGLELIGNQGTHTFFVYNNIVWNNYSQDILLHEEASGTTLDLFNNTYSVLSGSFPTQYTGSNKTGAANDPSFVFAGGGNYHLSNSSTSINTGAPSVPLYNYPTRDNDGGPRLVGSHVDRGAFESAIDDVTNLVVSTTADNNDNTTPTVGSIRWAIKQANMNAGASTITFSTACPTVFNLPGQLPDITSDVTIDGYHTSAGADVAGASANSNASGWNATLCPYLNGGNAIANGFRTSGGGRMTLTGVGFAGFTDAAVKLTSGSGHVIVGNQIGAVPFTSANHDGIRVTSTVTGAAIGDGTVGGFNWIADNTNIGVYIDNPSGNVVVQGNIIGLGSAGSGSAGNAYGLFLFNTQYNTIESNFIDDSGNAGITMSGISAKYNVVQDNIIGANGSLAGEGNGGPGVVINAGAAYNTIGAPQSGSNGGNYIADNSGAGVAISGGGVGNSVLGNEIFSNTGLAVDLGTTGPTPNDSLDADTGANDMQNFAALTGSWRTGASIILRGFVRSGANESYRLDFYRSPACRSFGGVVRGDMRYYLGRSSVVTDANGFASFSVLLPVGTGNAGGVSATATAPNGDTSEAGSCINEDTIFTQDFGY